jgi:predicted metal-dependent hydrolase
MSPALSRTDRAPRPIPVRRPVFSLDGVDPRRGRYWFGGDAFQTHLMHALSLTFPEGERFFMDAVRHYAPRLESPALRHEVSRFLAQEGMHGRAHDLFNEWVRALGNDTTWIEDHVKRDLARARKHRRPRERLAVTCALEHFTAILAELLLDDDELRASMEPEVRRLWTWHAIEETEHKAVAFDTYLAVGGTYRMRVATMLVTTLMFLAHVLRYQARLMRGDPGAGGTRAILRGWKRMWISPGILRPVIPAYLDYFRPGFHPWSRKTSAAFEALRRAMDGDEVREAAATS